MQMAGLNSANVRDIRDNFRTLTHASGLFRVEAMRSKSSVESFTESLLKNDITFRKLIKSRQTMNEVLKEQYRLQRMAAVQWSTDARGRTSADVVIPRSAPNELGNFRKNMELTRQGQITFGDAIDRTRMKIGLWSQAVQSGSTNLINWGKNTQWAGRQMMVGLTVPFAAAAAASGVMAYQFDKQFTRITRVYDFTAKSAQGLAQEQENLKTQSMETARSVAAAYGQAGNETLEVLAELAATGKTGVELQKSAALVQRASFLGELDRQDAMKATINMQSVYKMNTDQLAESFDYLNALENQTVLSMQDMVVALPRLTGVVKGLGGDIKDIGTLMTAARAAGLDAGEAANALKTIVFRAVAPTNKARETFLSQTGEDIDNLIASTKGEAIPMLKALAESLKNLSRVQRIQVVRDLFGIYQGSKGDMIIQQLLDMADATTQVGRANEVAGYSTEKLSQISQRETKKMQESASGRFKRMVEDMKVELAKIGVPFLEMAGTVVSVVTKIMKAFNGLGDGTKKFILFGGAIAAVIGPLVMIVGIFANFIGTIIKVAASFGGLMGRFKAVTIEQRTQELLAGRVTNAFHSEAQAAAILAQQLAEVNRQLSIVAQTSAATAAAGAIAGPGVTNNRQALAGQVYWSGLSGKPFRGTGREGPGAPASKAQVKGAIDAAHVEALTMNTGVMAQNVEKTRRSWVAMAGPLALASSVMLSMVSSSGSLVNNIANGVLVATMFGSVFGRVFKTLATTLKVNFLGALQVAAPVAVAKTGAALRGLVPLIARLAPALGPLGIAVGAITFGVYQLNKNIDATEEKMRRAAETGKTWADILGYTYLEAGEHVDANGEKVKTATTLVEEFAKANKDAFEELQNFADSGATMTEKWNRAIEEGIKVRLSGGTAAQAAEAVRTVMSILDTQFKHMSDKEFELKLKTRIDFADKEAVAERAAKDFAGVFQKAMDGEYRAQGKSETFVRWFSGPDELPRQAKVAIQESVKSIYRVYSSADKSEQEGIFKEISSTLTGNLEKLYSDAAKKHPGIMKNVGIGNFQEFLDYTNKNGFSGGLSQAFDKDSLHEAYNGVDALKIALDQLQDSGKFTDGQMKKVGVDLNLLAKLLDVPTAPKAAQSLQTVGQSMINYDNYLAKAAMSGVQLSEAQKLTYLNTQRAAAGLDAAGSSTDYFGKSSLAAADDLGKLNNQMALTEEQGKQMADTYKGVMQNVWGSVMDRAGELFDAQHEQKMNNMKTHAEAVMESYDQQADQLDDKWETRSRKFDDKWTAIMDKHENKWKTRIKLQQEEEDQRKAMFEAEKARISELARMENASIDFNVAMAQGNVDEAARVMSNAQAAGTAADMEASGALADKKGEARIQSLQDQEEAEKKALDKRKVMEQRAFDDEKKRQQRLLDHRRKMEQKKLDAAQESAQKAHEAMKQQLELDLAALRAYIPKDEADMQKHIRQLEAKYDKHGDFIDLKGKAWGQMLSDTMNSATKAAQTQLGNDVMWGKIGERAGKAAVEGAFGMNMDQFMAWLNTGHMPSGADGAGGKIVDMKGGRSGYKMPGTNKVVPLSMHTGGIVGQDRGGRNGYSGSQMPGEMTINALRGEAVLNKKATRALGTDSIRRLNETGGYSGGAGIAGMLGAGLAAGIGNAIGIAATQAGTNKIRDLANQSMGMMYGSGAAGLYGNTNLDAEQLANAATIMNVGRSMGATPRDLIISLMTAMQESSLRNIAGGDRDSVGLFQQRPSQGWGTVAQIMNPEYAARQFFERLLAEKNRDSMSLAGAAQSVQRSADGSLYAKWEDMARAIAQGAPLEQGIGKWGAPLRNLRVTKSWAAHVVPKAVDLGAAQPGVAGDPIYAVGDGRVSVANELRDANGNFYSYGRYAKIDHGNGLATLYAHMSAMGVRAGDMVKAGQMIGRMGDTGHAYGVHLHFETWANGKDVDPHAFGIPGLKIGGQVNYDNTIANLHRGETVLTAPLSKNLERGIDKMGNSGYNREQNIFNFDGAVFQKDIDVEQAVDRALRKRDSRRGHNRRID